MINDDDYISTRTKHIIIKDIETNGLEDWASYPLYQMLDDYASGFKAYNKHLLKAKKVIDMHPNPDLQIPSSAGLLSEETDFEGVISRATNNVLDFMCSYVKVHSMANEESSER